MKRLLLASALAFGLASDVYAQTVQVQQLPIAQTPLASNTAFWCGAQLPSGAWRTYNCPLSAIAPSGVQTFSGGSTGLTPNIATGGVVTLGGTLGGGFGGTGLTTFTSANNALYSTSSSALTAGTLPVAAGGTGSATQNFVDLSSAQSSIGGAKTFTTQLIGMGTATNDSAASGYIGQYVSSQVLSGFGPTASSGTPFNITSVSLTAGDWDVGGVVGFTQSSGGSASSSFRGDISLTSAVFAENEGSFNQVGIVAGQNFSNPLGATRISLSATTTVYLVGEVTITTGGYAGYGTIRARRVR